MNCAANHEQLETAMPAVAMRALGKRFGSRHVLEDLDLSIERGSFVAIVGRSGCGKSTLLRLIAGLEQHDSGELSVGAHKVRLMFQDARLLPWKSVLGNVTLGIAHAAGNARAGETGSEGEREQKGGHKHGGHKPGERRQGEREDGLEALRAVGLSDRVGDWPAQLSGGQRQRVALARALARRPDLLLLDEPLGALDALTRIEMHALIETLWLAQRFTAVLVTHDVQEAVALADRVILIDRGRIALDQPIDLPRPRARGTAAFARLEDAVLQRVLASAA